MSNHIQFDADTNRVQLETNALQIKDCVLTAEEVSGYLGKEIQGYAKLGMDADTIYGIYRPLEEIIKAQKTFNGLQLLDKHIAVDSKNPKREITVGSIGTDCHIEDGKLLATVTVWTQQAIDAILKADGNPDQGKKDLSCGYSYDLVAEKGTFKGKSYDFKMVNIRGNHVALVPDGRVTTAMISDTNFIKAVIMNNDDASQVATDKKARDEELTMGAQKIIALAKDADFEGQEDDRIDAIIKAAQVLKSIQEKEMVKSAADEDIVETEAEKEERMKKEQMSKDRKAKDKKASDKKAKDDEEEKKKEEAMDEDDDDKKDAEDEEEEEEKKKASDESLMARFAADAVEKALAENNRILSKVTQMIGRVPANILMDSKSTAIAEKALALKGVNAKGKSLHDMEIMIDTVIATAPKKPALVAHDSNSATKSNYKKLVKDNA